MKPLPENTQQLFDQRLFGALSETELQDFNQRLATEPELAAQWSEFQVLTSGLKQRFAAENASDDLRKRIAQADAELTAEGFFAKKSEQAPTTKVVQMNPIRRYWSLAAVLVLVLAAVWFFSKPGLPANADMFANNFSIEQTQLGSTLDNLEKMGLGEADAQSRQNLAKALELLEKQQFSAASSALKTWLAASDSATVQNRNLARYYLAQAQMSTGNTGQETIDLLNALTNEPTFNTPNDARWFLALCHLKNNDSKTARPLLESVRSSTSIHAPEAAKLLQQLQ
jgi:TolA-binding protein